MSEAKKVKLLGDQLQQDPATYANNVATILQYITQEQTEGAIKAAIQALKLYFLNIADAVQLKPKRRKVEAAGKVAQGAPDQVLEQWVQRQYSSYKQRLQDLLLSKTAPGAQIAAVAGLMEAVRGEEVGVFGAVLFRRLMFTLLTTPTVRPEVYSLLVSKYLPYADVRYHTLKSIEAVAGRFAAHTKATPPAGEAEEDVGEEATDDEEGPMGTQDREAGEPGPSSPVDRVARDIFDVLSRVDGKADEDLTSWCGAAEVGAVKAAADNTVSSKARRKRKASEAGSGGGKGGNAAAWANTKLQHKAFSDAWLAFLRMPLPEDIYRKVLMRLHSAVIPNLPNPVLLSDFLTFSLDKGGMVGMLALNGIFQLVTQHGLEYPQFYKRLYNLLTPDAFVAKHRSEFFQLTDIFLASGLVPAYTAGAFAKRFARLSLTAPPAGAMIATAFIHNLLRRHPSVQIMLHRPLSDPPPPGAGNDPYDPNEEDPAESRAVESSLWEIDALRRHQCPQVAAFVGVLDKDLSNRTKTTEVVIEPLLKASYSSLFSDEAARRIKVVPVAFYKQPPTKLFDINSHADFVGWDLEA